MPSVKRIQSLARVASLACVCWVPFMAIAGEKEDSPVSGHSESFHLLTKSPSFGGAAHIERNSATAIKHGFGNFVLQKDSFIERIAPFEDGACRSKVEKNFREIVFLEFRQKLQMQKISGEWNPSVEIEKMARVLNNFQKDSLFIHRRVASLSAKTLDNSHQEKTHHLHADYSFVKSWQIEAQADPDSVIRQCHAELLLVKLPKEDLKEAFKGMSKCRIENDLSCHQRWIEYCPTYKIEYLGSLSTSMNQVEGPQPVLCKKALEAIVSDFESPLF